MISKVMIMTIVAVSAATFHSCGDLQRNSCSHSGATSNRPDSIEVTSILRHGKVQCNSSTLESCGSLASATRKR